MEGKGDQEAIDVDHVNEDGERYVGQCKDGKRHGFGTAYRSDGAIAYTGEWAND